MEEEYLYINLFDFNNFELGLASKNTMLKYIIIVKFEMRIYKPLLELLFFHALFFLLLPAPHQEYPK